MTQIESQKERERKKIYTFTYTLQLLSSTSIIFLVECITSKLLSITEVPFSKDVLMVSELEGIGTWSISILVVFLV